MNEPYFRDYHPFFDQQPDVGRIARLAEPAGLAGSEYPQELAVGNNDTARAAPSGEACTTKVQFPADYPAGTVLQVRRRNRPCLAIEISMAHRHERTTRQ